MELVFKNHVKLPIHKKEGKSHMKPAHKYGRSLVPYILTLVFFFSLLTLGSLVQPQTAHADLKSEISNYGINSGNSGNDQIQAEVKTWMDRIRLIGFGVVLIALILAGISFGTSLGNAQRRSIAIGACISALLGIWLVFKTETLAGYMVN